ncbi:MAG: hypothetical protein GY827_05175 [Cytophagales bacterium]|nr:hypothetical protein [Cytophagales bacterium]
MILESKYKPTFWLRNGHISTIFTSLFRKHHIVNYERKRIKTPDNDFLDLDCLFQNNQEKLAIIFHGLESDTQQDYMTGMAKMLFEQGFPSLH